MRLRKKKNEITVEGKYNTETDKLEWKVRPKNSDVELVIRMLETMLTHLKSENARRKVKHKQKEDISYIS